MQIERSQLALKLALIYVNLVELISCYKVGKTLMF